jgi:hypothetical protein
LRALLNGADVGRLAYRHVQLASGDVLIDEAAEYAPSVGGRRSSRLHLAGDCTLKEGEWHTSGPLMGDDTLRITRVADSGAYAVDRVALDGYVEHYQVATEQPLVPGSRLTASAVACLKPSAESSAISVDADDVQVVPMTVQSVGADEWEVRTEHPSQINVERYRLDADRRVLAVNEATWMGARELRADE